MDTLDGLLRKINSAEQLKSVVGTMKALAAANIGQFESAVKSLEDYYRTIILGIVAYLRQAKIDASINRQNEVSTKNKQICAIVLGSDQGLVGQFNDSLLSFMTNSLRDFSGAKAVWAVGERMQLSLANIGWQVDKHFYAASSVNSIAPLVSQVLEAIEKNIEDGKINEVYLFYNRPQLHAGYQPLSKRLLPLDEKWRKEVSKLQWPTKTIPEVAGGIQVTLNSLIHEYFFVSLFKACAESSASENASRLNAMQRAEKNIEELLEDFGQKYHQIRQTSIDEELFDVISGFEAMISP